MALKTFRGSCHCGALKYEADIDLSAGTSKCNCTYCRKVRSWKAFVKPANFRLLGEAGVAYHKHAQATAKFHCATCGVQVHETGNADYMGGPFVGVFIGTIDDATPDELAAAPVRYSDGLHNNWMSPPAVTSYL